MQLSRILIFDLLTMLAQAKQHNNPESHDTILVVKPHCQTMNQFQDNFEKLCPVWIPPPNGTDGFIHHSTIFNKGDWDGKFQRYLATVNCLYVTLGSTKNVGGEIADALGGAVIEEGW